MIVFGLDPLAARMAAALASGTTPVPHRLPAVTPQATSGSLVADLRRCVADSMAAARARGEPFEPRLGCLVTASAPEAVVGLDALPAICAMLQALAAGNQTVAMVVLVPAADADDIAKGTSFRFFRALEDLVGELPFLDLVFVNQLTCEASSAVDDGPGEEIQRLLVRELLDPDLRHILASLGHAAVRLNARVAGRKACYSTLGTCRLEYRPTDALEHLAARLQRALWTESLMARERGDDDELKAIQARADEIIRDRLATIEKHLPPVPPIELIALAGVIDSEALARLLLALPEEVKRVLDALGPTIPELGDPRDGWARQALLNFLAESPTYFGGARAFLDALLGRRLVGDADATSGVEGLSTALCHDPLVRSVLSVGERLLRSQAPLDAKPPHPQQDPALVEWLVATAEALAAETTTNDLLAGAPVRLLAAAQRRLRDWLAMDDADGFPENRIVHDLLAEFQREATPVLDRALANRRELAEVERKIEALPHSYGLFARLLTRRAEYWAAQSALAAERGGLESEHETLRVIFLQSHGILKSVLNEIVLPQLIRRRIDVRLRGDAIDTSNELAAFLDAIETEVEARWARAASVGEDRTTTGSALLTRERLDTLYRMTLERERVAFPQAAKKLLTFFPRPSEPSGRAPRLSYRDCHGLADQYLHGPESLLDRMADYTHHLSAWVRDLDALDIIECEGKEPASRFLADVRERSQRFLDLSPGMIPLVEAQGHPRAIFAVRTAVPVASKLAAAYGGLFPPELSFVDNNDRHVIEIISLAIGFPAFLIHVLHEGRKVVLAAGEEPGGDLWPREAA